MFYEVTIFAFVSFVVTTIELLSIRSVKHGTSFSEFDALPYEWTWAYQDLFLINKIENLESKIWKIDHKIDIFRAINYYFAITIMIESLIIMFVDISMNFAISNALQSLDLIDNLKLYVLIPALTAISLSIFGTFAQSIYYKYNPWF